MARLCEQLARPRGHNNSLWLPVPKQPGWLRRLASPVAPGCLVAIPSPPGYRFHGQSLFDQVFDNGAGLFIPQLDHQRSRLVLRGLV